MVQQLVATCAVFGAMYPLENGGFLHLLAAMKDSGIRGMCPWIMQDSGLALVPTRRWATRPGGWQSVHAMLSA